MKSKLLYLIGITSCLHAGVAAASSGTASGMATEGKSAAATAVATCNVETYQQAVQADPKSATAHNHLGICLQRNNKLKQALAEYKLALELRPDYAEVWNNMGTVFHIQTKYKKAVKHYQKALEAKPDMATTAKNMGTAYLAMGKIEEAYAAYDVAYKLDAAIFDASSAQGGFAAVGGNIGVQYFYIAKLNARAGRLDAALDFLAKAQTAGFRDFDKVRSDPAFKAVVADARFDKLTH
jgi:tetratricopeptide (TPR) repeat protein